jgi:hypothetical protein
MAIVPRETDFFYSLNAGPQPRLDAGATEEQTL